MRSWFAVVALLAACSPALEVPAPRVSGVQPASVCVGAGATVTVSGSGFTPVAVSTLDGPRLLLPEVTLGTTGGERAAASRWLSSAALEVTIPDDAPAGPAGVRVRNPDGSAAELAPAMSLIPGLRVTAVEPAAVCSGSSTVTVRGMGFAFGVQPPRVNIGAIQLAPTNPAGCSDGHCTAFDVHLPATLPAGNYVLAVENAAGCPGMALAPPLEVRASPSVASVETDVCAAPTRLIVHGAGFVAGSQARVDDQLRATTVIDGATLDVALAAGDPTPASTLSVTNPDGCAVSQPLVVGSTDELRPFFVAPPAVWTGAATPITVHLGDSTVAVRRVVLRRGVDEIALQSLQAARPGEVDGVVPAGVAAGSYDVIVEADACKGVLAGGVRLVADLDLPLGSLTPSFATAEVDTAVTVVTLGAELDETPMLYLAAGGRAVPLIAVAPASAWSATAVAPALPSGSYDLLAVTPSGRVGRLAAALSVSTEDTPAVASITPVSIGAQQAAPLVVRGSGFAADAAVTLHCDPPRPPVPAAVTASSPSEITATLPGDLAAGDVCVVRVSNGDPTLPATPYDELSALVVTNGSRNLGPFEPAGTLAVARRAPAALASRVTSEARFVCALGGDDGSAAGALTSVECAAVDRFGRPGPFTVQRNRLLEARSFAGAGRIGGYVYVAGGAGVAGALDSVERARVLDPARVPAGVDVSLTRGNGPGAGVWVYRVAAVVPVDGETLPSEPASVIVPSGVTVTVRWRRVPGAVGYRVYRTPAAGQPASAARLLVAAGDVTSVVDFGTRVVGPGAPLEIGALGAWTTVDTRLTVPRQGHAVVTVPTGEGTGLLFAGGGGGTDFSPLLGSYEVAALSDTGAAPFRAAPMGTPRALAQGYLVDRTVKTEALDRVYVYFAGGGRVTGLAPLAVVGIDEANAGMVGPDGLLEDLQLVRAPRAAGAGAFAASGLLFALGGLPSVESTQDAPISSTLPILGNWSAGGGGALTDPRALMGTAVESAFVFVLGGVGPAGALATVERTLW